MDNRLESTAERGRSGEVDALRLILGLWRRKSWIILCTTVVSLAGLLYAMLSPPVYLSQATIGLKEAGKGNDASRIFSQFGGMGGMMAAQLGLGSTNLAKVDILLQGHELAEDVITRNGLLPVLFPDSAERPPLRRAVEILRRKILRVEPNAKSSVILVGCEFRDPALAKRLVEHYLDALNDRIRGDVIRDAEVNREYLGRQLANTLDPVLREKIQSMIGMEIEKSMLVSTQAFEILEKPVEPLLRLKPKKKVILVMSFLLGFALSVLGLAGWQGWLMLRDAARRMEAAG